MSCSLPHLLRRTDYLRVARDGRTWVMPGLLVQVCPQQAEHGQAELRRDGGSGTCRVGVTASRKVGKAVARNRVRRRLRAAAGEVLRQHGIMGCDYVLIGRAATLSRPFAALVADLTTAMKRLRAYRPAAAAAAGERTPRQPDGASCAS